MRWHKPRHWICAITPAPVTAILGHLSTDTEADRMSQADLKMSGSAVWTHMRTAEWSQVECKPRKHKTSKTNVYVLWQLSQQHVLLSEFLQGAQEDLTPAELRLDHHFTMMLYFPGIRFFLYRILAPSLKAGAEIWSQNRTLVQFSSFTQMAPLVVQKALPHLLQHSFP